MDKLRRFGLGNIWRTQVVGIVNLALYCIKRNNMICSCLQGPPMTQREKAIFLPTRLISDKLKRVIEQRGWAASRRSPTPPPSLHSHAIDNRRRRQRPPTREKIPTLSAPADTAPFASVTQLYLFPTSTVHTPFQFNPPTPPLFGQEYNITLQQHDEESSYKDHFGWFLPVTSLVPAWATVKWGYSQTGQQECNSKNPVNTRVWFYYALFIFLRTWSRRRNRYLYLIISFHSTVITTSWW